MPLPPVLESGGVAMGAGGGGGGGGLGARAHYPGVRRGGCHQPEALLGLGGETTGEARGGSRGRGAADQSER